MPPSRIARAVWPVYPVKGTFKIKAVSLSSAKLSYTSKVYTGSELKPTATVTAKVAGETKTLKAGTDYTISYKNNKNVGTATVTIKGTGNYLGTITKTFKINPKATSVSSVTAASKAFTVKWKKQTVQTTGYQIQYSTNKNFKSGNKIVTVSKNSSTAKKITELAKGKTYYVRVRTYKTVSGTKYYSTWSSAKSVKTK